VCIFRFGFGIYFNHQRESGGQKMNVSERIKMCKLIAEIEKNRVLAEKNGLINTSVIEKTSKKQLKTERRQHYETNL